MAGRVQQDSFIDDSDETCPLCVEEFDLSDRNFRPCPCGYQVCQFCFNNIKNNMNGLCPACRRPYNDETIEWKVISPEEFKADVQKQARKKADQRQREVQKREVESLNRKHLSGLRVVQKNLVYVTGLTPRIREEDLLHTLRGERYFGQYGKIVKIVVSKSKDAGEGSQPLGVYVTFARKQDAESCIAAVDGSDNGGRILRAQFGTTKYCSAYLRNETCSNKNCMFLHEPGEEKDSFTRQDLSSINVVSTQRPAQSAAGPSSQPGQPSQSQASTEAISQPPSAAQSMQREPSRDEIGSPTDSQDSSALPSSASWAIKNQQQASRRTSQAASASTPSPHLGNAGISSLSSRSAKDGAPSAEVARSSKQAIASSPPSGDAETSSPLLNELLKSLTSSHISFVFAKSLFAPDEYTAIANHPQLFDPAGGAKRRAIREAEEKERRHADEQAQKAVEAAVDPQAEEIQGGGSLQLGGEPEGQQSSGDVESRPEQGNTAVHEQHRQVIQPPSLQSLNFGPTQPGGSGPNLANLAINGRGLTQSQQQHLMLLKSNSPQSSSFLDQLPQGLSQPQQTPTYLQSQAQHYPAIHGRQSSRYTFANDTASASASVKPAASAKLMAQQSSMMPAGNVAQSQASQGQQHQQSNSQFYGTSLQGPPPGLKSAGTPPISGGGMFSQGHGFAGSAAAGMGTQMDGKSDLFRDALRSRSGVGGVGMGPGLDGGKLDLADPNLLQARMQQQSGSGAVQGLFSGQAQGEHEPVPTSLDAAMAVPFGAVDLTGGSRPPVSDWVSEVGTRGEVDDADAHSAPSISRAFPTPAPTPLAPIGVTKVTSATPQSKTGDPDGSNITDGQSSQKPLAQRKPSMEITREMEQKSPALPKVKELPNAVAQSKPVEAQTTRTEAPAIKTTRKSLTETETDVNKTASPSSKRLLPGKLDIAAATRNLIKETQAITAATAARKAEKEKEMQKQKQSQKASEGSTPGSLSAAAHNQEFPPLRQSNPRTLRVVQTPKTEVRPSTPAPSASSATAAAPSSVSSVSTSVVPGSKAPSRRPSVNSLTQPATPGSELVSDNASFTTAPLSRANSPPLKVSKSQSKKQRRVAKKTLDKKEPEEVLIKIAEPEAEHAPIVGRKKKKSKQAAISDDVAAAASGSMDERQQQEWVQPLSSGEKKDEDGVATGTAAASSADATAGTEEARSKRQSLATPLEESGVPMAASAPTTPDCEVTTATLLASLIESGQLDPATHPFFQPVKSFSHRPAVSPREFADVTRKIYVTPAETDMLQILKAVRHDGSPPHEHLRFMISPGGYFLRGMPKETEDRFLELEASIRSARSSTVFQPAARERRIPAMASSVAEPAVMAIDTPTEEFTPVSHFSWDESFSVGSSTSTSTSTGTRDRKQLLSAGRYGVEEIGKAWAEEKRKAALLERKLGSLSKRNREWLREAGFKL